jgi:K(+)-stimulated pyrophosphate-energized sodium pump
VLLELACCILPLIIAGAGILLSILGTFFVKVKEGGNPQTALNIGEFGATGLMFVASYFIIKSVLPDSWIYNNIEYTSNGIFFATLIGLVAGYTYRINHRILHRIG